MDYIKEAENELKNYVDLKQAIPVIREELDYIESKLTGIQAIQLDKVSGESKGEPDDYRCNLLFKKQMKEEAYHTTKKRIQQLDRIISQLGDDGRLLFLWYIKQGNLWELQNEFNVSERQLYRMKATAIRRMAIQLFGLKAVV